MSYSRQGQARYLHPFPSLLLFMVKHHVATSWQHSEPWTKRSQEGQAKQVIRADCWAVTYMRSLSLSCWTAGGPCGPWTCALYMQQLLPIHSIDDSYMPTHCGAESSRYTERKQDRFFCFLVPSKPLVEYNASCRRRERLIRPAGPANSNPHSRRAGRLIGARTGERASHRPVDVHEQ